MWVKLALWLFIFASIAFTFLALKIPCAENLFLLLAKLKAVIDVLAPIGVFLLSIFGLFSWREELTFKKRYDLSEKILLAMKNIVKFLREIRDENFWEAYEVTETVKDANKSTHSIYLKKINLIYDLKKFEDKSKAIYKTKMELKDLLDEADVLWVQDISSSSKELFLLADEMVGAVEVFRALSVGTKWEFDDKYIETNHYLQLIYNFYNPTANKTVEELNDYFNTRLKKSTNEIQKKVRGNVK